MSSPSSAGVGAANAEGLACCPGKDGSARCGSVGAGARGTWRPVRPVTTLNSRISGAWGWACVGRAEGSAASAAAGREGSW